jgi:predicted nucleic acid-binding Zn ribbon protein
MTEPDSDDHSVSEPAIQAARAALARARAVAVTRGFRPGIRPRRRTTPLATTDLGQRREPQELALGLDRLIAERGWQVDVAVGAVVGRWTQVVGPNVATHCVPASFRAGLLTVQADSTAWATQFRLLVPHLLRRLDEELGEGVVSQVVVKAPSAPSWRRGRRTVSGPGPRDTYG